METQVVEGTYEEVQQRLNALHLKPETHLRVVITEQELAASAKPFAPAEYRNGIPLLPRRELPEPITLELVKRLLDEDGEENDGRLITLDTGMAISAVACPQPDRL